MATQKIKRTLTQVEGEFRIWTICLMILAAVAVAGTLSYTRPVMIPFVLAIFASYIAQPVVELLVLKLRLPKSVALALTLLTGVILMSLIFLLLSSAVSSLISSADLYRVRILNLANDLVSTAESHGFPVDRSQILQGIRDLPFFDFLGKAAGHIASFASTFILVVVFVFFILSGRKTTAPRKGLEQEIHLKITRYLVIRTLTSTLTGILVGGILSLLGVDLALLFGVLTFLLNFIPTLGSIIATLLPIPIALLQMESLIDVFWVIAIPGTLQFLIGTILEPRLLGQSLDLHPVTLVLSLIFWGLIWGTAGAFLAVPITAILKIVLERFPKTRVVGALLAGRL